MKRLARYSFYGGKNSGKTSVMSRVITKLVDEGYRVAAVKHSREDYTVDSEGTDTYKHAKAGAELVVFSTSIETSFILKEELNIEDITEVIESIGISDVVLLEGYKDEDIKGIDVGNEEWDEETLDDVVDEIEGEINVFNILNKLPFLDCGKCGYSTCEEMARAVIEGTVRLNDCTQNQSVILKVNNKSVKLTEFPANMMKKTIIGMIESLKGVEEIRSISIEISAGDDI